MPNRRLLLVDDERPVLDALVRAHRKRYDISVAIGGHAGLETMEQQGPFDVVVSDYQMPEMNGVAFLKKVSEVAPDCVRLMLTGNADLQTAIDAVNTGHVFRFLTKPCSPEVFASGIDAAIEQVRLRRAERDLLECTLKGSIQVLCDVLSLCNPDAFGRANRIRGYVAQVVVLLKLPESWQVESAALLSQIGCITLPADIMERVVAGNGLTEQHRRAYAGHPGIGARLLEQIPRLEEVAAIVARQRTPYAELCAESELVKRGSQVLAACLEFDELITLGASKREAIEAMSRRPRMYAPEVLKVMSLVAPMTEGTIARSCLVVQLSEGMILAQDIRSKNDTMILASGHRVTRSMIEKLRNYHHLRGIKEPIHVMVCPDVAATDAA
jgi:response regulator RpfG family c-di-GMP phosphodiesterase